MLGWEMTGASPLRVGTESLPDGLRIVVHGELDLAGADDLTAALEAAEAGTCAAILLDLSGVTFMDSAGTSVLVRAGIRSQATGDRLSITPSAAVDRVIDLCGLRGRLPLA